MSRRSDAAVLVFTRGPASEGARKRLHARGGADPLGSVFAKVLEEACASGAEVVVAAPERARLPALPAAAARIRQQGSGSVDRLEYAIAAAFARGAGRLVVIGDDTPEIRSDDLRTALQALSGPGPRAVVGPSRDGGFYLLALNRPAAGALRGIPWGSRRALAELVRRLRASGFELSRLRPLADLDDRAGLEHLGARARRHASGGLRAVQSQIAVWIRIACAWMAPRVAPLRDEALRRLVPSRAPPALRISRVSH